MLEYHGTSCAAAQSLAAGNVSVANGGGELGRGFYSGEHLHLAKAWAAQRHGAYKGNVVEFDLPDAQVLALNVMRIAPSTAVAFRNNIRKFGATRTFMFLCDMVWANIVGNASVVGDQCKWESTGAEAFLNGATVGRKVI
jgi:hypothetical protein